MPEIGEALDLLIKGMALFGTAGLAGIAFGIWDKRAKARQDDRQQGNTEAERLEASWKLLRDERRADLEAARIAALACEERCEACQVEMDRWVSAGRAMEDFARDQLRHVAADWLLKMWAAMSAAQRRAVADKPPHLPEVPRLASLRPKPSE